MQERGTASAKVFSNVKGGVAMDSFFSVFSVWVRWPGLQGKSHSVRRLELLMGPAVAHWFSS